MRDRLAVHALAAAKRYRPPRTSAKAGPVKVVKAPKVVLRDALQLAGGDASRLDIRPDGSIIVWNHGRRPG